MFELLPLRVFACSFERCPTRIELTNAYIFFSTLLAIEHKPLLYD
jgi:hypothetical protein